MEEFLVDALDELAMTEHMVAAGSISSLGMAENELFVNNIAAVIERATFDFQLVSWRQ